MRHSNPTCQASTQPTGKARPIAAGSPRQADCEQHNILADREAFLTDFSSAERLQLSEAAKINLDEEISMLSHTLRRFVRAAENAGEEKYPVNLAKALDLLGLTCSRMASVLRVNIMVNGSEKNGYSEELLKQLTDFGQEIKHMSEEKHD